MSSFQVPGQHLSDALRALRSHRVAAQAVWRDLKRVQFEQDHLLPLEQEAQRSLRAMNRLAELLSKAIEHAP